MSGDFYGNLIFCNFKKLYFFKNNHIYFEKKGSFWVCSGILPLTFS